MTGIDPALIRKILAGSRAQPGALENRVDCGCEFGTVGEAFVIRPCSVDCKVYRYAEAERKRQGVPMAYVWEGDQN